METKAVPIKSTRKKPTVLQKNKSSESALKKMLSRQNIEILRSFTQKEFSEVYLVTNPNPGEKNLVIKKKNISSPLIINEQMILDKLKGIHIERIVFYEVTPRNVIKFSQQLGPSIKTLFKMNNNTFSTKTICNIGISVLNILEKIHEKGIIHNSICPSKILTGIDKMNKLYLIDFSQVSSDIESLVKEKINISNEPDNNCYLMRTPNLFSSLTLHLEKTTQRIDDIECLAYTLLYFFKKGKLFKKDIENYYEKSRDFKLRALGLHKLSISIEKLCEGAPKNFDRIFHLIRNQNPSIPIDYKKIKEILTTIKNENKLTEKKNEDFYEWLSWPAETGNHNSKNNNNNKEKKKTYDYAINLLPIEEKMSEEKSKKEKPSENKTQAVPPMRNVVDKISHLNEITFKNSFVRRNSPKKLFQPLSTLTEEQKDFSGQPYFNSLQDINIPNVLPQKNISSDDMMEGEISPQKLSDKVKKIGLNEFKIKFME